jgi:hypothetical protein
LVVDDDEALRRTLAETFIDEHCYSVVEAATLADADKTVDDEDEDIRAETNIAAAKAELAEFGGDLSDYGATLLLRRGAGAEAAQDRRYGSRSDAG